MALSANDFESVVAVVNLRVLAPNVLAAFDQPGQAAATSQRRGESEWAGIIGRIIVCVPSAGAIAILHQPERIPAG